MTFLGVVLRATSGGLSKNALQKQIFRNLSMNASGNDSGGNQSRNSSESNDDFVRRIFDEDSSNDDPFFAKLDKLQKVRAKFNQASQSSERDAFGALDDSDYTIDTLADEMDGKLEQAASYFEFDEDEVDEDGYRFRPDMTFRSGGTYEMKDLDLTKPGVWKPVKRPEFEVTTKEVMSKADFRNVRFLANFLTEAGIIIKRSQTKISAKAQRRVAREIKTARAFGLLPFTTMGTKSFVFGKSMEGREEDFEYESYEGGSVDDVDM